jgi:hypothetical protein
MLLLALPHLPSNRTNSAPAAHTGVGHPLDAFSPFCDSKAACDGEGCPPQQLVPDCCMRVCNKGASACIKRHSSTPDGANILASKALCEGLEKGLKSTELIGRAQYPEAWAITQITPGTSSRTRMMHVPPSSELTEVDDAWTRGCGAKSSCIAYTSGLHTFSGLGSHQACSQAATCDMLGPVLKDNVKFPLPVREPGRKGGNVWSAFIHAQLDLLREVRTLRTVQQAQVSDCVVLLSYMLRKFSEDVLWSQHMRSAAAAATALSTPAPSEHSTAYACNESIHPRDIASCCPYEELPKRACMSPLQARGFMHAVNQLIAITSAERMHVKSSLQVPGTKAGDAGQEGRLRLRREDLQRGAT